MIILLLSTCVDDTRRADKILFAAHCLGTSSTGERVLNGSFGKSRRITIIILFLIFKKYELINLI